jgi:hypothetical protein
VFQSLPVGQVEFVTVVVDVCVTELVEVSVFAVQQEGFGAVLNTTLLPRQSHQRLLTE